MSSLQIFPKLFIGQAVDGFKRAVKRSSVAVDYNSFCSKYELIPLLDSYSSYKNYNVPIVFEDVSFLSPKDQVALLSFLDNNPSLKVVLLASRDNVIEALLSRVKVYRKVFGFRPEDFSFLPLAKAREAFDSSSSLDKDSSYEDRLREYSKFNPLLSFTSSLVRNHRLSDSAKLLALIET